LSKGKDPIADSGLDDSSEVVNSSDNSIVLVGLPAFNEEVAIGSTVITTQRFADEVVVVDDGSTDRTAKVAEAAGATVLQHESNQGKGRAVQTLFEYAKQREVSALVLLDADGQHIPLDIPDVIAPVLGGKADVVIGSRYLHDRRTETPKYRRVGQQILDKITPISSKQDLSDTQSGFRAFSPRALDELQVRTNGIGVESEIVSDATSKNLELTEVPIRVRYGGIDGQTYNPVSHGLAVVMFVLNLIRDRHPLIFFTLPGLALVFFGTLYGLDGVLIYRSTGVLYPAKLFVSGFLTIIGSLAAFMGLMLNSLADKFDRITEE
jgi:glycosyltransferase involved in cell wall biosynthesis